MELLKSEHIEHTDSSFEDTNRREWRLCFDEATCALLYVDKNGQHSVKVKACFPWTDGLNFLSLIDEDGRVLETIEQPLSLPDNELVYLMKALKQTGFLFDIEEVFELDEEFELWNWKVKTKQGIRRFQTSNERWPRNLPDGSYLLEDVGGDVYRIHQDVKVSKKCHSVLFALLD